MTEQRPHNHVVVVAGLYRSGSTFMYNAVRVLYKHAGHDVWGGGTAAFVTTDGTESDVYVVKEHRWIEELAGYADVILTSTRPLKDAYESMNRFKRGAVTWPETRAWVGWLGQWRPLAAYNMKYEWLAKDGGPYTVVSDIASVLGLENVNRRHVLRDLRSEMAPPKTKEKDPTTLVFANHYTSRRYDDVRNEYTVPDHA